MSNRVTRYKSIFGTTSKSLNESRMKPKVLSLKEKAMKKIRYALRELAEETDTPVSAINSAVSDIEDIVIDAISNDGLDSPIVDTLSDAARQLKAQADVQEDIETMTEAEESDEDDTDGEEEESAAEKAKEKKEESRKSKQPVSGRRQVVEAEEDETDDEDEDEMEEAEEDSDEDEEGEDLEEMYGPMEDDMDSDEDEEMEEAESDDDEDEEGEAEELEEDYDSKIMKDVGKPSGKTDTGDKMGKGPGIKTSIHNAIEDNPGM